MAEGKVYFTIGEVATSLEVKPSTLRFYEKHFPHLKPHLSAGGSRRYSKDNIEDLKEVIRLTHKEGHSLGMAKKMISSKKVINTQRQEVIDLLQDLKTLLITLKDQDQ